jgi:predicted Zn-dependent protease with MMP-like domain
MSSAMREGQTWGAAPDAEVIEGLARAAMSRLPEAFRAYLDDVVLRVDDFADEETLHVLGIDDPFALSGLYRGRPVGEKSIADNAALPDMIFLYRRALLDEWADSGETLEALVTHVLVHEVGHHFGLSDADMHALEEAAG